MALLREKPKAERKKHVVTPIHGEFGRYTVPSASAAKKGQAESYIVDVLAEEETNTHGKVTGTCGCKRWQIFKVCSHLEDAREYHRNIATVVKAEEMGFEALPAA